MFMFSFRPRRCSLPAEICERGQENHGRLLEPTIIFYIKHFITLLYIIHFCHIPDVKRGSIRYTTMENGVSFAVPRIMLTNFSCQTKCQRVTLLAKDKRFTV